MAARTYEELEVWQKAHRLVLDIYSATRRFPREELYGLTSQVRRSSASTAANIVEGFRRPSRSDKLRFYQIALASLDETHYPLRLAHDLHYADTRTMRSQVDEVTRMLSAYTQAIIADRNKRTVKNISVLCLAVGLVSSFFPLLASRF